MTSSFSTQANPEGSNAFSTQVGGNHYKELAIQPLEFIVANNLDFCQGNVVKYVVRYKVKGGLEDLKKARHYLDMLIELKEKEIESQKLSSDSRSTDPAS